VIITRTFRPPGEMNRGSSGARTAADRPRKRKK
jgi:hypothetical protein